MLPVLIFMLLTLLHIFVWVLIGFLDCLFTKMSLKCTRKGEKIPLFTGCVWNALLLRTCSYFWYAIVPEVLGFSLFNDKTRSGVYFETYVSFIPILGILNVGLPLT